jgi:hypothetical protein
VPLRAFDGSARLRVRKARSGRGNDWRSIKLGNVLSSHHFHPKKQLSNKSR